MQKLRQKEAIEHIVSWLRSYCEKAGTSGFVVGISGGIDSALTSTLCALTGKDVLCVEMPIHQAESQVNRAQEHIAWLQGKFPQVRTLRVDLTPTFEQMKSSFPSVDGDVDNALPLANTRARLRMSTLYYFAGLQGLLVAGTGNKVEDFGVGFFTKYGDGGVDLSPIADLYKSEVYQLAEELGIVQSIRVAAPTDGLFGDNRSDEDQIGATYDELEWAMEYLRLGHDLENLSGRQAEVMSIYQRRHRANQHKMVPIPVCTLPEHLKTS